MTVLGVVSASALVEFLRQPFGAVGAICIMLAVTVVNSVRLKSRFPVAGVTVDQLFNGLNLIGGTTLLVNAVLRDEVVWTVLETYFIAVAIKGIVQSVRSAREVDWANAIDVDLTEAYRQLAAPVSQGRAEAEADADADADGEMAGLAVGDVQEQGRQPSPTPR